MMPEAAETIPHTGLSQEWKRIEILALCLLESRTGRAPSKDLLHQLKEIQHNLDFLRREQGSWDKFNVENLPDPGLDLLAGIYAPLTNPNVALQYQDLQQSRNPCPTLAFLYRLLSFNDQEYLSAQKLVEPQGELVQRRLITIEGNGPMVQLKPHPMVLPQLTGNGPHVHLPGAVQISIDAGWDDLIIPKPQKRMLKEYLLWIRYSDKVVNDWGGRPVGGPIALFSGPSGTGKTFAAGVIANALDWSLHRVDLGLLISKYIGETEKNLNTLFDAAHGQDVLLQFDEVDALMGKRGEVKDARDRYANMEVSHLLSRIEQHQGPCILTTNLSKHIDSAFQRRFHFVVTFPQPEKDQRLALWKFLIPKKAPVSKTVDLKLVAGAVALSGGEIRNAAMHASILAASTDSEITMVHISTGIWRVLQKNDGKARQNKLRQLAKYLPGTIFT